MNREAGSQQQLNLTALQRIDNKIVSVLGISPHVAVYRFDESSLEWHRGDVEGSLFIVKRLEEPYERLVVLNRLSTKNLVEDINEKLLIKCQGPYLIYKNNNNINGIWFYEEADQPRIFNQLKDIQKQKNTRPPVQQPQPQQPQPQQPMQHPYLMSMSPPIVPMINGQIPIAMPQPVVMPPQPPQPSQPQPPQPSQPQPSQTQPQPPQPSQTQPQPPTTPTSSAGSHLPILEKLMSSVAMKPPGLQKPSIQAISVSSIESQQQYVQQNQPQPQPHHLHSNQPTLTKDQLKEILKRLVNDDQFITQVYSSYISQTTPS